MAKSYLRQIILEEIKKVLKEAVTSTMSGGYGSDELGPDQKRSGATLAPPQKVSNPTNCSRGSGTIGQGMKFGCRGDDVAVFQNFMNFALKGTEDPKAMDYELVPDGVYGEQTANAVKLIQSKSGVKGNGKTVDATTTNGITMFAVKASPNAAKQARAAVVRDVLAPQYAKIDKALNAQSGKASPIPMSQKDAIKGMKAWRGVQKSVDSSLNK